MYIQTIINNLPNIENKRFSSIRDKGSIGKQVEIALGLSNSQTLKDCVDGEIKTLTTKPGRNGVALKDAPAITQVPHTLDDIVNETDFYSTKLFEKMKRVLFIFLHQETKHKTSDKSYTHYGFLDFQDKQHSDWLKLLEQDYEHISNEINNIITNNLKFHTINGPNKIIQIRTKDSLVNNSYNPIKYKGKVYSNKNYAWYFKKNIIKELFLK